MKNRKQYTSNDSISNTSREIQVNKMNFEDMKKYYLINCFPCIWAIFCLFFFVFFFLFFYSSF